MNSRRMRRIAGATAALFALTALWLYARRNSYITSAVQTYGSAILGVKVTLEGAHLDVAGQSLELRGLMVGNPPGYKSRAFLRIEAAKVGVDVTSLAADVIEVREITLVKPEITYEKIGGVSNMDVIQRNADNYARAMMGAPPGGGATKGPEKRWIISSFQVRDAKAIVLSDLVLTDNLTVPVPNVHLRDIGRRTHGATTANATQQVMSALTASIGNAVGTAIAGAARGVGREVGKGVKGLGAALHGLFGR